MASPASAIFYRSPFWRSLRRACIARDGGICTVPGCRSPATHADHIRTRPRSATPAPEDRLENLRSLCAHHDAQAKELRSGRRRRDGSFAVSGSDADGWPRDPRHNR